MILLKSCYTYLRNKISTKNWLHIFHGSKKYQIDEITTLALTYFWKSPSTSIHEFTELFSEEEIFFLLNGIFKSERN